jgi:23S rRNA (cytidine1920-2'-O)/16S rRNA (cytidine1409-2'-O)-methyltransferase
MKNRADVLLVLKKRVRSRRVAADLILAGKVSIAGVLVKKPSQEFPFETDFSVQDVPRFVGRGGDKFQAALEKFKVDPKGLLCLDIGASTGGATDCLLQNGAKKVYAVDVGTGQLASSLYNHLGIVSLEGTDIRSLVSLPEKVDCIVIALVKPQFEVGREHLPKDGVVKNDDVRREALEKVKRIFVTESFSIEGEMECPVVGQSGNREFLLLTRYVR